jgi:murein DD-endopeptidase MepM/ murein hydrolase activator NlpD
MRTLAFRFDRHHERRFFGLSLLLILLTAPASGGRMLPGGKGETEAIPEPAASAVEPVPVSTSAVSRGTEIIDKFQKNENIVAALRRHGVEAELVTELVETARPVYNLSRVKADQNFWLNLSADGEFLLFRYVVDEDHYLSVYRKDGAFVPELKTFRFEIRTEPVCGVIHDSLFNAVTRTGEPVLLAEELAGLFQWDIDFNTDIQKGDSFRLLVEKKYLNGRFVRYGAKPILAADLLASKKNLSGFRFLDEKGSPAYFAPDGRSLKKSFLKSPLTFVRISSRFTNSRFHPVLKIFRPHLGVDYAAPAGTPVQAVASGTVEYAGWNGEGGRTVKLRHSGGFQTSYMHLSNISVRQGARISQGEQIGRVGATGLATGPHLDFRVYLNGKPQNPTRFVVPPGPPVDQSRMGQFTLMRNDMRARLDQIVSQ